jgi:hypothetical protein
MSISAAVSTFGDGTVYLLSLWRRYDRKRRTAPFSSTLDSSSPTASLKQLSFERSRNALALSKRNRYTERRVHQHLRSDHMLSQFSSIHIYTNLLILSSNTNYGPPCVLFHSIFSHVGLTFFTFLYLFGLPFFLSFIPFVFLLLALLHSLIYFVSSVHSFIKQLFISLFIYFIISVFFTRSLFGFLQLSLFLIY